MSAASCTFFPFTYFTLPLDPLRYEILTGEFLFEDDDWIRFFIRVTGEGQELLTPEKLAPLEEFPLLVELLEYILVRDPIRRPSFKDLRARFQVVRGSLFPGMSSAVEVEAVSAARGKGRGQKVESWVDMTKPWAHNSLSAVDQAYYSSHPSPVLTFLLLGSSSLCVDPRSGGTGSLERMLELGVTHIIDCSEGANTGFHRPSNLAFLVLRPDHSHSLPAFIRRALAFIRIAAVLFVF